MNYTIVYNKQTLQVIVTHAMLITNPLIPAVPFTTVETTLAYTVFVLIFAVYLFSRISRLVYYRENKYTRI